MSAVVLQLEPLAVDKETAAAMLRSMSVSTLETLGRTEPLLKPVQISGRLVGYPVENLRAWLRSRPPSEQLPPEGSGYGRAGKHNVELGSNGKGEESDTKRD